MNPALPENLVLQEHTAPPAHIVHLGLVPLKNPVQVDPVPTGLVLLKNPDQADLVPLDLARLGLVLAILVRQGLVPLERSTQRRLTVIMGEQKVAIHLIKKDDRVKRTLPDETSLIY